MKYEGPPYYVGDIVNWLGWKNKLNGFPRVRRGHVWRIKPARSMHGPTLYVRALDGFGNATLLPGLHGVSKVSAVDALAELGR